MDKIALYLTILSLSACAVHTAGSGHSSAGGQSTPHIVNAYVDRLEQIYVWRTDNTISVRPRADVPDYVYANNRRGRISAVDINNPLKIIVYYRDYMELQILDNTLSEVSSLSLDQLAYDDVRAVTGSNDNNIWIYDAARYQLIKIGDNGEELLASINLTELRLNRLDPTDITEGNNRVYVTDPAIGIVVFDNLGQYIQTIPLRGVTEVYIDRQTVLYQLGRKLYGYNQRLLETTTLDLPEVADSSYIKIIPSPTKYLYVYPDTIVSMRRL